VPEADAARTFSSAGAWKCGIDCRSPAQPAKLVICIARKLPQSYLEAMAAQQRSVWINLNISAPKTGCRHGLHRRTRTR
jgi:hypothetical protein